MNILTHVKMRYTPKYMYNQITYKIHKNKHDKNKARAQTQTQNINRNNKHNI